MKALSGSKAPSLMTGLLSCDSITTPPSMCLSKGLSGSITSWKIATQCKKLGRSYQPFPMQAKNLATERSGTYHFVVDGNWVTDHTAPQENDDSGNLNNILTPDRINILAPEALGIMSGVTPNATTASLVGAIPLEKDKRCVSLPGTFPETPAPGEETNQPKIFSSKVSQENNSLKAKEDTNLLFSSLSLNAQHAIDPTVPSSTGLVPDPNLNAQSSQATLFTDSTIQSVGPQSSTAALAGEIPKILRKPIEQNNEDKSDHANNNMHTRTVEPENEAFNDSTTEYIKPVARGTESSQDQNPVAHLPLPNSHELVSDIKLSGPVSEQHSVQDIANDRLKEAASQIIITEVAKNISDDLKDGNILAKQIPEVNCCKAPEKNLDEDVASKDSCPANRSDVSTGVSSSTAEPVTDSLPVSQHVAQPVPGLITEQTTRLSIPDNDLAASCSNSPTITDKADKKKKRSSFFGKLKAKLIYKDKD
ncbi:hypothetical protein BGHDH14_bgh03603 [Blumeria hordei DH14]|uniref:AMP-activated protein kinase glycogen-binding domain-containing protein n=1 Tax=Blumeria graminis f. sp. hordei (strain DH14) TaxID=546991 RepID=N1JP42_BLUG1|nr:hypothetical protein BGHDH14_bgh03603 [Blumeria hordei DH14]